MIKQRILIVLLLFIGLTVQAQKVVRLYKGTVTDSATSKPIRDVTISFYKAKDTTLENFCFTTPNGNYNIELHTTDSLLMVISCIGYKERIIHQKTSFSEWSFEQEDYTLKRSSVSIGEIKITAGLITMKGDTIEINATRLKVLPNSDVSQLLQKIPGFEIKKDGSIKVNGSVVSRIVVDGSDFFGSNPALVSKNLNADMVDKVQVFDDKNDDGKVAQNNSKTINLKLKKGKRLGVFGDAMAGAGTDNHYEAGLRINSFKDDRKLSFISNSNNINDRGFDFGFNNWHGWSDLQRNGSGTYNTFSNPLDISASKGNINRNSDAAFSYFNEYSGKRKLSFNISYANNNDTTKNSNNSFNALNDSTIQKSRTSQLTRGKSKNIGTKINYSREKDTTIRFLTGLTLGLGNYAEDYNSTDSVFFNNNLVNSGINNYSRTTNKTNAVFNINYYQRSHHSPYTYFRWGTKLDYNYGSTINYQYSRGTNSNYNYKTNAIGTNFDALVDIKGSLKVYKSLRVVLDIDAYQSRNDYNATAYNAKDSTIQDFNQNYNATLATLSTHFFNAATQFSSNLFLAGGGRNAYFDIGCIYLNLTLYNKDIGSNKSLNNPYNLFLPYINYNNWKESNGYTNISLTREVDFPTNIQLLPVSILSNPWVRITGNPNLLPFEQWSFNGYYNKNAYKFFKDIWVSFTAHQSNNYVANNNTVDQQGITYRIPVNLEGYFTEHANLSPTIRLNKILNLDLEVSQQYNKIPAILNGNTYIGTTKIVGFNPSLEITVADKVEINLTTSLDYTQYINPDNRNLEFSQNISTYSADIRTDLWKGAEIKSDITVTDDRAIPGIGKVVTLLNAYYQQEIDKRGKYNLKLTCYDILNQNVGLSRSASGSYISIQQNNILQRFFMLTFIYKMKGKKTESGGAVY